MIVKFFRKTLSLPCLCFAGILFACPGVATSQPARILENHFFYNDIYNFGGDLIESPSFSQTRSIAQSFVSQCSDLNRIVLSFYIKKDHGNGTLTFNLYRAGEDKQAVASVPIQLSEFPKPEKIGTYSKEGILHYVWLPPGIDSRKKAFFWEVVGDASQDLKGVGLYLTNRHNPRLTPVSINGAAQENAYAAFYSYCRFTFEWGDILETTWERMLREKYFLGFYLLLVGAVGIFIISQKADGPLPPDRKKIDPGG